MSEPRVTHRLTRKPGDVWTAPGIHAAQCAAPWDDRLKVEIGDAIVYLTADGNAFVGAFTINRVVTRFVVRPAGEDMVLEVFGG